MIGRRLRSGFYAVPVLRAELLRRTGEWTSVWCIELECGHVLDEHRSWTGTRAPRWAGCPHGCGAEIGRVRRELKAKFDAFTVGNPDVYEPALCELEAAGEVLLKSIGGVAFRTAAEAEAILKLGQLPPAWAEGRRVPGRVYGLRLLRAFEECTEARDGLHFLTIEAPIERVSE